MEPKKFLTAAEVAEEFGVDAETLQQHVDAGDLRALADRGTWKYRRDELQALQDAGRLTAGSELSLSEGDQILAMPGDDEVSYIELDEAALAEHATTITPGRSAPSEEFPVSISESDEPPLMSDSDSDVHIAPDFEAPRVEDSGILLDFNLDAGATVSSSGSSLRLPQTVPGAIEDAGIDTTAEPVWDDPLGSAEAVVGESGVLGADAGSHINLPMEESGILIDEGSHVGMAGGSSILASSAGPVEDSGLALQPDSGISLESDAGHVADSGIALESSAPQQEDSGISLFAGDSGLALSSGDSGISLSADDSGISLGMDSGLSLEAADSGLAIDGNAKTIPEAFVFDDDEGGVTQTVELSTQSGDSEFEINLDEGDATAELFLDDDVADDTSATVVRKGRPAPGSLSEAFELDDAEVEDLEISEDLDAGVDEEVGYVEEEEEVFDSSDDMFGEVEAEAEDVEDDFLEPAAKSKKPTGPREPSWGAGMAVGLIVCSLFLAANSLILWAGVSTMWNGADVEGPAASLITSLGDLIK